MKKLTPIWLLLWLAGSQASAQAALEAPSGQGERARIAAQRQLELARYAQQEKDCAARFLVNDCLAAVKSQRREALAELRRREISLDEAERSRKAAQQAELAREKSEPPSSGLSAPKDPSAERLQRRSKEKEQAQAQSEVAAQQRAQQQAQKLENRAASDAARAAQADVAAKNARAYQEKRAAAQKHKADLLLRQQGQTKAPAKPLPDPPSN